MRLEVTRSGGFAGLRTTGSVPVDDAETLRAQLTALPPHEPGPDRFVYELTLGEESVRVGEQQLPDDLRALVKQALDGGFETGAERLPQPPSDGG